MTSRVDSNPDAKTDDNPIRAWSQLGRENSDLSVVVFQIGD